MHDYTLFLLSRAQLQSTISVVRLMPDLSHAICLPFAKTESRRETPSKFICNSNAKSPEVNKALYAPISGTPDVGADVGFRSCWAFSSFIYSDIDL